MPVPAAPRPICPTVLVRRGRAARSASALMSAASVTTAVPCWSSCITGFASRCMQPSLRSRSTPALRSPPAGWRRRRTRSPAPPPPRAPDRVSFSRIGTPLMPTSSANSAALPSITGRPASAPMLPSPSTAVPLVMMATVLPMAVYSRAACGILLDGEAHPRHARGVHVAQHCAVLMGRLATVRILPPRWRLNTRSDLPTKRAVGSWSMRS